MLNHKKFYLWAVALFIILGIAMIMNPLKKDKNQSKDSIPNIPLNVSEAVYSTEYERVKIEFLSDIIGFKKTDRFETTESQIVGYIDSAIRSELKPVKTEDLDNNHTNQYRIELSDEIGGYSCTLYYDTLYDKAYLIKDGGSYEIDTDFARYIDSFLENTNIELHLDDNVVKLFQEHGWTLDYQINSIEEKFEDISILSVFNPSTYYFVYNNELSKDIGLDMSGYSDIDNIKIEIYRVHESMPEEFYPVQDCRGIVVKDDEKIIGAFISAGRHSTFDACSLKGNSFEKVVGKTIHEWLGQMIEADDTEEKLSKLEPKQIIEGYFQALDAKDSNSCIYYISKKSLLGNLTSNILDNQLFNEKIGLPLAGDNIGEESEFQNLKSAKLLKIEEIDEIHDNLKVFRVIVDLQYHREFILDNGEQQWDCHMVYESPQTGWKIKEFGH